MPQVLRASINGTWLKSKWRSAGPAVITMLLISLLRKLQVTGLSISLVVREQ
nr:MULTISPECIES: hypothetical protein [unclassified Pseudomonas]